MNNVPYRVTYYVNQIGTDVETKEFVQTSMGGPTGAWWHTPSYQLGPGGAVDQNGASLSVTATTDRNFIYFAAQDGYQISAPVFQCMEAGDGYNPVPCPADLVFTAADSNPPPVDPGPDCEVRNIDGTCAQGGSTDPTSTPTPTPTPTSSSTPGSTATPSPTPTPSVQPTSAPPAVDSCYDADRQQIDCSNPGCNASVTKNVHYTYFPNSTASAANCGQTTDPNNCLTACTERPTDLLACVNINPVDFKFDIPCIWALLFVPSDALKQQVSAQQDTLFYTRDPFFSLQRVVAQVNMMFDGINDGTCKPVQYVWTAPFFQGGHLNIVLIPCFTEVRGFLRPATTFASWLFITGTIGAWVYRRVNPSLNENGSD